MSHSVVGLLPITYSQAQESALRLVMVFAIILERLKNCALLLGSRVSRLPRFPAPFTTPPTAVAMPWPCRHGASEALTPGCATPYENQELQRLFGGQGQGGGGGHSATYL